MIGLRQHRYGRTVHIEGEGSFRAFFDGLREAPDAFHQLLCELPFEAISWELPALVDLDGTFRCVALDHPHLARMPVDATSFAEHFQPDVDAVRFLNLRGDSELIAPCPQPGRAFPHLLAWARQATPGEARALWGLVADAVCERLETTTGPTWVSTAGMGVGWLHVRLDPRPKYYRYGPFRTSP